jgi:hypothetical protein
MPRIIERFVFANHDKYSLSLANFNKNFTPVCRYLPNDAVMLEVMLGCYNCKSFEETLYGFMKEKIYSKRDIQEEYKKFATIKVGKYNYDSYENS